MTVTLDMREEHLTILHEVLRQYLPPGTRAYVFGSRARGGARRYSDLDLAVEWDHPLGLDVVGQVAEALSLSDLPYKVDIIDLATAEPSFRQRVIHDCLPIRFGG